MQGHCPKNCNYDYINRLAFRIFLQRFNQISKHKGFVLRLLGHKVHEEIFSHSTSILIEEFCSCHTEPHLRLTCPRASQNTKQYNLSTTNHAEWWMICDFLALRPILPITQKTLSFLHSTKVEQITKTMVIFKTGSLFLCCIPCDPIPSQTSVHRLANTRNVTTCYCSTQVSNATSFFPLDVNVQGESLNSKMDVTQGWVVLGLFFGSWNDRTQLQSEVKKINIIPQRRQSFYFQHPVLIAKQSSITKFLSYTCNLLQIQAKFVYRAVFCAFPLENFLTVFYKIESKSTKMNFSSGASHPNCNFFQRKTLH